MTGNEKFNFNEQSLDIDVLSYWRWSSTDLLTNRQRGILAEFLVASALDLTKQPRQEWEPYDLITDNGLKIEVKSSAYVQSWEQNEFSKVSFGIKPTMNWNDSGKRSDTKVRQADLYVFCVLKHKDKHTINPLNLNQWDFYILETSVLDEKVPNQKTITLPSLLSLNPVYVAYTEIKSKIQYIEERDITMARI
jgi:hypothetical protein